MTKSENGASQKALLLLEWWKPVYGMEGWYEVSNLGHVNRVKASVGTRVGKPLKWMPHRAGYPLIIMSRERKPKRRLIHHLVMEAFVGPRPEGMIVNHIDGVKENPRLSNLEYVTPRGNYDHAVAHGLVAHGVRCKQAKLNDEIVARIKSLDRGITAEVAASMFGVTDGAIYRIWHGKSWKHVKGPLRRREPAKGRRRAAPAPE